MKYVNTFWTIGNVRGKSQANPCSAVIGLSQTSMIQILILSSVPVGKQTCSNLIHLQDEHYRLRKKNKPNDEILERLVELKANLSHGLTLCQMTHTREQLKLRKLMYIYETVMEVHYLHTNHSGPRPLTYNVLSLSCYHVQLKSMFVYEGRTSSILSATSSANAYATFNPVASRPFNDSRFMGMGTFNEEY